MTEEEGAKSDVRTPPAVAVVVDGDSVKDEVLVMQESMQESSLGESITTTGEDHEVCAKKEFYKQMAMITQRATDSSEMWERREKLLQEQQKQELQARRSLEVKLQEQRERRQSEENHQLNYLMRQQEEAQQKLQEELYKQFEECYVCANSSSNGNGIEHHATNIQQCSSTVFQSPPDFKYDERFGSPPPYPVFHPVSPLIPPVVYSGRYNEVHEQGKENYLRRSNLRYKNRKGKGKDKLRQQAGPNGNTNQIKE